MTLTPSRFSRVKAVDGIPLIFVNYRSFFMDAIRAHPREPAVMRKGRRWTAAFRSCDVLFETAARHRGQ